ncbi:hypothetical protein [Nocardioides sp. R-C-SC26]|uniref:hypothetical protein n=1 Tax=Nocardioides sp. R-C-SC26 TaxID=2870414 RepID=UPI001E612D43|nr:hypothetical protein [Nocardioides sp. R-C-SC26]
MSILFHSPDAQAPDAPETTPRRGPRWHRLVLVALLFGLIGAGAGVGARLLLAEPSREQPAPQVTCWDGEARPRVECGMPTGANGLRWVYPSLRPHSPRCSLVRYADDSVLRPTEYQCFTWLQGDRVQITYSRRTTAQRSLSYLAKVYAGVEAETSADGERLTYRPTGKRGGHYELTELYMRYPFSVTVRADTVEHRDLALAAIVQSRPVEEISVRPDPAPRPRSRR